MTPTKLTLAERLAAVSAEVERLGHDGQMQGGGSYKYTSINAIADAARPLLAKHGVTIVPGDVEVLSHEQLAKGYHVVVKRDWRILNGPEEMVASSIGASSDSSDKAYNKAHTYARKNFLVDLLNLSTGEDPDSERPETAPRSQPREEGPRYQHPRDRPERPRRESKSNYEDVVAEGKARGLTLDGIHDVMKALGYVKPSDLNDESAYREAKDAVLGRLRSDDKGGLPTGVDQQVPVISAAQAKRYQAIRSKAKVSEERGKEIILDLTGQDSSAGIPKRLYDTVIATIEAEGEKS